MRETTETGKKKKNKKPYKTLKMEKKIGEFAPLTS